MIIYLIIMIPTKPVKFGTHLAKIGVKDVKFGIVLVKFETLKSYISDIPFMFGTYIFILETNAVILFLKNVHF